MRRVHVFAWLLFLHIVGLLVFSRGFFLTRRRVEQTSVCAGADPAIAALNKECLPRFLDHEDDVDEKLRALTKLEKYGDGHVCWRTPRFKRAVLVLVDALRHDFTESYPDGSLSAPYLNHMPVFQSLCRNDPTRCLRYKFVADAPTTTSQRLKGLTTGSLPTFLEMSRNFDSDAVEEDNIVHQLVQSGKRIAFLGDDTWSSMFPATFSYEKPFPSFNVWDLDGVDDGILKELPMHFNGDAASTWDVLIAHFLGVDHAGHR